MSLTGLRPHKFTGKPDGEVLVLDLRLELLVFNEDEDYVMLFWKYGKGLRASLVNCLFNSVILQVILQCYILIIWIRGDGSSRKEAQ